MGQLDSMDCNFERGGEALARGKIFVTRVIPRPGLDLLREHALVELNESDTPLSREQLHEHALRVDGMLTLLTDSIDGDVIGGTSSLKVVANCAVGFDNVNIGVATELGIAITNTPGVLTDTTADFAWALMMAAARRVVEADVYTRAGKYHGWGIQLFLGHDVHHATLGIVGMGRIGHGMARRASGFDMRVLYSDEVRLSPEQERDLNVSYVDLDTLLSESDFVSIHVPLTEETRHLMNWERFQTMKPTAILVNTSRGPVIKEADLARALEKGVLAGAALDVFEEEPAVFPGLVALPNVVLAPHIASASHTTRARMATMAAENCLAVLEGKTPPNAVNPQVLQSGLFKERLQTWA